MLSVKLVRSLVLGETIIPPSSHTHDDDHHDDSNNTDTPSPPPCIMRPSYDNNINVKKNKKKMPMLLFIPTRELITDTFRLATIARDLGFDFYPNSSLSHLFFSWPSPSSSSSHTSSSITNHRTSVSSQTSTFTQTSASTTATATTSSTAAFSTLALRNDAVPIPFPSLSTNSSISLLRSFVSLSKGLFKLVFVNPNPDSDSDPVFVNYYHALVNYDAELRFNLFSRVSGKRVKSIDDLGTELAGKGWSLFRSPVKKKSTGSSSLLMEDSVYLFRKLESNRVRVRVVGGGECSRIRELRLPLLDFEKGLSKDAYIFPGSRPRLNRKLKSGTTLQQ